MAARKNWIAGALRKHKAGSLHRALKVKKGNKIPVSKLRSAAKKGNTVTARRARLALTLRRLGGRRRTR